MQRTKTVAIRPRADKLLPRGSIATQRMTQSGHRAAFDVAVAKKSVLPLPKSRFELNDAVS